MQPGKEYVLCAASLEQARICFRFVREWLEPTGEYRFIDSVTRLGITHKPTNTKLRVMSPVTPRQHSGLSELRFWLQTNLGRGRLREGR